MGDEYFVCNSCKGTFPIGDSVPGTNTCGECGYSLVRYGVVE